MTTMDIYQRAGAVEELISTSTTFRRAADLIRVRGYNRHAVEGPDNDGRYSVTSALIAVARDREQADVLLARFAGFLYLCGAWWLDRPHYGVSGVTADWEQQLLGARPDIDDVIRMLGAAAAALTTYAELTAFPAQ